VSPFSGAGREDEQGGGGQRDDERCHHPAERGQGVAMRWPVKKIGRHATATASITGRSKSSTAGATKKWR